MRRWLQSAAKWQRRRGGISRIWNDIKKLCARAEQLRAEERDAYVQRLQAEQEERRRESERAREQLEQQEREAEQRLVEELQRER